MIAAVHSVLNKSGDLNFDQLIALLNNVVLLKKPENNGFLNQKDFWPPLKFWTIKREISSTKVGFCYLFLKSNFTGGVMIIFVGNELSVPSSWIRMMID